MSNSVSKLPPRDVTGRFTKRRSSLPRQPSADHSDQPESPIAPPSSTRTAGLSRPSRLQRLLSQPPDISDDSSIPFSALVSRTASALNAPDSDSVGLHTPSPDSPVSPAAPTRPSTAAWDDEPPLPAPNFSQDSQDSLSAAPAQAFLFPDLDFDCSDISLSPTPARKDQRRTSQHIPIQATRAPPVIPPRPLLLPTLASHKRTLPQPAPPAIPPRPLLPTTLANSLPLPASTMSNSTQRSGTGPAAMPPPRSHRAPYFSGNVDDPIEDFLREYEELADDCALTSQQKVETIIRYIPVKLRDLWKSLDGYVTQDWAALKRVLEHTYDGASARSRHSKQKLYDFARYSSKTQMNEEEDVLQYYRRFLIFSKPLVDARRLTEEECNKMFWLGFHPRDRSRMFSRLIAKHPDQNSDEHFNYLDVYKVARATFSGNHLLDLELDDPWDDPPSSRRNHSDRAFERWLEQEERDARGTDSSHRTSQRRRDSLDFPSRDIHHRYPDRQRSPAPEVETKVVRFKESTREEDDHDVEDLVKRMHGLSVREQSYAVLYARCAFRFPSVAQCLPKPILDQNAPAPPSSATTFSLQTPAPPPPPSHTPWPVAPNPAPPPQFAPDPSAFFHPRARTDGCSFCSHIGHRVRECPTAQEYVRSGRATVLGDRLYLPNGQPIPNDGSGRGLKHGIDSWLASQSHAAPVPPQRVSFTRETPPHLLKVPMAAHLLLASRR